MSNLKATKRNSTSTGQINKLREKGLIPGILYGGKDIFTEMQYHSNAQIHKYKVPKRPNTCMLFFKAGCSRI